MAAAEKPIEQASVFSIGTSGALRPAASSEEIPAAMAGTKYFVVQVLK
jgi:hypothetical protein